MQFKHISKWTFVSVFTIIHKIQGGAHLSLIVYSIASKHMAIKSTLSYFWLGGVLVVIIIFFLYLTALLIARYRWLPKRLPIIYCAGADSTFVKFDYQYILRVCYDRDPRSKCHDQYCQLTSEIWFGEDDVITVPLNINKVCYFTISAS